MRAFLLVAALIAAALTIAPRDAAALPRGYSGNDLLQNCANTTLCELYLRSLVDAYDTLLIWSNARSRICVAQPQDPAVVWRAISTTLAARPDRLPASAGSLALDAIQVAYRCPTGGAAVANSSLFAPRDGVDLATQCTNFALCEPILFAVLDAHQTLVDWQVIPRRFVCLPDSSTLAEWRLDVLKYLGAHLDQLPIHTSASLVLTAMAQRHPC
jgi:hypothetical protein